MERVKKKNKQKRKKKKETSNWIIFKGCNASSEAHFSIGSFQRVFIFELDLVYYNTYNITWLKLLHWIIQKCLKDSIDSITISEAAVESIAFLLKMNTIFSLTALEIKGPGQELCVNEGSVLKLKYKLSKEVPLLQFFKDNTEKEKVENVKERFFEIKKADTTDNGEYFAQANSIKSKITKVIVQCKYYLIFTDELKFQQKWQFRLYL